MKKLKTLGKYVSGALSFSTLILFAFLTLSSLTFLPKDVRAQVCGGGSGSCGIQVCAPGYHDANDPICQPRYCCVPDTLPGTPPPPASNGCPNGTCMVGGCAGFTTLGSCTGADQGKSCCSPQAAPTASITTPPPSQPTEGLVQCGKGADPMECDFEAFMALIPRLMNFLLFVLAIPFAAISFAWAGWLYLSSAGNPGGISSAHKIFFNVVLGLCISLAAWLVVHAIVKGLGVAEIYNFLGS